MKSVYLRSDNTLCDSIITGSLQGLLSDGGNIGQVRRGLSNQARRAGNRRNKVTGSGTRRTGNSPSKYTTIPTSRKKCPSIVLS